MMKDYLDLDRRFGLLTKYSVEELKALNFLGHKQLDWAQLLSERYSLITARANFGKTTELRACARRLRDEGKHAVFVALHQLLDVSEFQFALDATELDAYKAWITDSTKRLYLFVDSLDEAVLGRDSGLQSALRKISNAVSVVSVDVSWILSSRPATLTPSVLDTIQAELKVKLFVNGAKEESSNRIPDDVDSEALNEEFSAFGADSTVKAKSVPKEHLKIYGLLPLSTRSAKQYLENRYGVEDGWALLKAAQRFGLHDLAAGPGSLDVLFYIDPVTNPPSDLTSVFELMVAGVQVLQRRDRRESQVGSPSPDNLDKTVEKLAAASVICQLPNMEMAADALIVREGVLSCRLLVGSLLSESSLKYLLGSRLFIDSGLHQVKLYPEQLLPYLAAKRLSSLVNSPEDAGRLIAAMSWRSATGECGVHRAYLAVAGWLATFNAHCRLVLLEVEPQAVAFFGDLRSPLVPPADARKALVSCLKRLSDLGDTLGRNLFSLTAENYWQAAKPGIESTLLEAYDTVGSDWHARNALLDIATYARLGVFRDMILSKYDNNYANLLSHSDELAYLISLERDDDAQALADAAMASSSLDERTLRLLLSALAWRTFEADTIAELASRRYTHKGGGFNLSWSLTHDVADSANPEQLVALTEGLLSRMVTHYEAKGDEYWVQNDNFVTTVQELIALVIRNKNLSVERVSQLCLTYFLADGKYQFGSTVPTELHTALRISDAVRQHLLRLLIAQSDRTANEIWRTFFSCGADLILQEVDIDALAEPGLTDLMTKRKENTVAQILPARPRNATKNKLELDKASQSGLLAEVDNLKNGSNTKAFAWIAKWLMQTTDNARYGECDFSVFEKAAEAVLASAARSGLSAIWRTREPEFNEADSSSTYYVTVAGLQGLHLDLGDGSNLPALTDREVKQALTYGRFEINGYPKWFWSVVRAHELVALGEFRNVLSFTGAGAVSADHAVTLIRNLPEAPPTVQRGLSGMAWEFATASTNVDVYTLESALTCAVGDLESVHQDTFEDEALSRMSEAFCLPLPNPSQENANEQLAQASTNEMIYQRLNAVVWGKFWLLHYPSTFGTFWERWRTSEQRAADEFMFDLAAYLGQDRRSCLSGLAKRGLSGLKTLSALYEWVLSVVRESEDVTHEDGVAHSISSRDNAERLRDSLLPIISSAKSQAAYEVLDELRRKPAATGTTDKYIRTLQFQMREEEAHVAPIAQKDYDKFERDFAPPVTDFTQFAQAVHNDLIAVKRDIEHGEFSLRRFFNRVVMKHIKTDTEGLALEEDFQALLGSELNHLSCGRYVVTLEPILPEATRRDVLCQAGQMRATVELKMSERWTVEDYLIALEQQLKGQYMQALNSKIGFFVVVLQRRKNWHNPTGGTLDFEGLLRLLEARALELQAEDSALFLRIIGIDATPQTDFRELRAAKKAAVNGLVKYADECGNTWSGKGRRPKWLKDALASGMTLTGFEIRRPAV